MGEVWERQIKTVKGVANALLKTEGKCFASGSLYMLLLEVEDNGIHQ